MNKVGECGVWKVETKEDTYIAARFRVGLNKHNSGHSVFQFSVGLVALIDSLTVSFSQERKNK